VLVAVALVVALAVWAGGNGAEPTPERRPAVEPVPQVNDPGDQARNLADWLRENSR
jgi:hypothetical protein